MTDYNSSYTGAQIDAVVGPLVGKTAVNTTEAQTISGAKSLTGGVKIGATQVITFATLADLQADTTYSLADGRRNHLFLSP